MSKIDVHAHYIPDSYREAAVAAGHARPDGMPAIPAWDTELALETMDQCGIDAAILSISSPGVYFGDDAAVGDLAREVNTAGADTVQRHPERFGLFASLPLPDVDAALAEIEFAFDRLNADGVVMMTNYHGRYLGDPLFEPIFRELDRRGAVVFIHPTSPVCEACSTRAGLSYPAPMIEFMFDTTRAIANLMLTGTLSRNQQMRLIVPHAGAAVPTLSDRIARFLALLDVEESLTSAELMSLLGRMHFDLAGMPVPKMLGSLLAVSDIDHLLYGSDWPFTPTAGVETLAAIFDQADQFSSGDRERITGTNALSLFPRFAR